MQRTVLTAIAHTHIPLYHGSGPPKVKAVINATVYFPASEDSIPSVNLESIIEQGDSLKGIEWRKDGKVMSEGTVSPKFIVHTPFPDDENKTALVYMLTVRNVQESDEGIYECRVFSNYSRGDPEAIAVLSLESEKVPPGIYIYVYDCHLKLRLFCAHYCVET